MKKNFELANELKIKSTDLILLCKKESLFFKNHMQEISEEEESKIKLILNKNKETKIEKRELEFKKTFKKCDKCLSKRIAKLFGYDSDNYSLEIDHLNIDHSGYPAYLPFFDYQMNFSVCLDCGKIQGTFPINDKEILESEQPNENEDE